MEQLTKILIVEDESIVGIDLKRTLIKLNYNVIGIERTGEDAVKTALSKKPDLILMDIMLSGPMTGIEAAENIRKKIRIPVIYLTAYTDSETLRGAKATEPFGYIVKPYDERVLFSTIEMALHKHKLEDRVKESEERYRALVELAPVAIGVMENEKVVFANPSLIRLLRAKGKDQILGLRFLELVHPDFRKSFKERMKVVSEKQINMEVIDEKLITFDKKEIDAEVISIPTVFNERPAVQFVIRDITEELKREKVQQTALRILQSANTAASLSDLYHLIFKTLSSYMPLHNFYIALYNEKTNKISFPYFVDEFLSKPDDREFGNGLTEYIIKKGESFLLDSKDIYNLSEAGEIKAQHLLNLPIRKWLGVPIQIKENNIGVLVAKEYHDENYLGEKEKELLELISFPISRAIERKLVELERESFTNELQELNKTKDEFFSIISHDLRSPFNSILGYTDILRTEFSELEEEEIKFLINSLYQSTRNIFGLLNNLLQFSRFQLGKISFSPEDISLNTLINKNVQTLEGSALYKEIKISNNISKEFIVFADEDMLNSIIQNLISNAIKFTKRGGNIKIEGRELEGAVEISVMDNGVGISDEMKEKIFNLNNKHTTPGTENEGGTGLGLVLTKQFIEKLGGNLKIESQVDSGSSFIFTLPLVEIRQET